MVVVGALDDALVEFCLASKIARKAYALVRNEFLTHKFVVLMSLADIKVDPNAALVFGIGKTRSKID